MSTLHNQTAHADLTPRDTQASFLSTSLMNTTAPKLLLLLLLLAAYLTLVQLLRTHHLRRIQSLAKPYTLKPYAMPYPVARDILRITLGLEFPLMYLLSMQLALLKTYAVGEQGTSLLVQTRQLACPAYIGKRLEDTGLILAEIMFHGPHTQRGATTLARLNWLHARYGRRITQLGLLHTLSMFILQPIEVLRAGEWRGLMEVEEVALFVVWRDIGLAMGIEGIWEDLAGLRVWREEFDKTNLAYSDNGRVLADASLELYMGVFSVPGGARGVVRGLYAAGLDEAHRKGIGMDAPTLGEQRLARALLGIKRVFSLYFALPRFVNAIQLGSEGSDGRLYRHQWINEPWYVRETLWVKLRKLFARADARLPGPAYGSHGYLPEELGPAKYEKMGHAEIKKEALEIQKYTQQAPVTGQRCPFKFGS